MSLRHFGVWRAAVGLLALLSIAVLAAWIFSGRDLWSIDALAAAAVAAAVVLLLAASVARVAPATLRLQEGSWTFAQDPPTGADIAIGQVDVALDLGSFMLLSLRPALASGRLGSRRWLPAQRHGHEHDWHALRCAAYSPRPAPAGFGVRAAAPPE